MNQLYLVTFALIFASVAAVCAIWAIRVAYAAVRYSKECADWMGESNKKAKIVRLESEMTEIVDSMAGIRKSLHKMRSRASMQDHRRAENVREKRSYASTPEGRDEERAALERELSEKGMLNPKIHSMGAKHG